MGKAIDWLLLLQLLQERIDRKCSHIGVARDRLDAISRVNGLDRFHVLTCDNLTAGVMRSDSS